MRNFKHLKTFEMYGNDEVIILKKEWAFINDFSKNPDINYKKGRSIEGEFSDFFNGLKRTDRIFKEYNISVNELLKLIKSVQNIMSMRMSLGTGELRGKIYRYLIPMVLDTLRKHINKLMSDKKDEHDIKKKQKSDDKNSGKKNINKSTKDSDDKNSGKKNINKSTKDSDDKNSHKEDISKAISCLVNGVSVSPSTKHILRDIQKIENKWFMLGNKSEVISKLKELEPEINKWDSNDDQYLMKDDQGLKNAPTSQLKRVLSLLED